MARGKITNLLEGQDTGVLKLIKYNLKLIEDNSKSPNYQLDEYVGACVDANGNHELVKIKQVTVSEDNIKSVTNVYEDKYKIGDTYQEWISMDKYLSSYAEAYNCYKEMAYNNELSKLSYCKDINTIIEIGKQINDKLEQFALSYTVPEVVEKLNIATKKLSRLQEELQSYDSIKSQIKKELNELVTFIKESHKIVVENMPKEKKHKVKLEEN